MVQTTLKKKLNKTERLNKFISAAGVCSRRAADELISLGQVSVNGKVVKELGIKVCTENDKIEVNGRLISHEEKKLYRFYKPKGVVTTLYDPHHKNTLARFTKNLPIKVFPIGRLDKDAFGLLLLTNDGALAEKLTHPRFEIPRMYVAEVKGKLSKASVNKAKEGIFLEDGFIQATLVPNFKNYQTEILFPVLSKDCSLVSVTIAEGRKHLVKRLLASFDNPVVNLSRVTHGDYALGNLKSGELQEQSYSSE